MRSKKLMIFYLVLIIIIIIFMFRLRSMRPEKILQRDYPEIAEEGVLRLVTDYNQDSYFISGDSILGFHYELIKAISEISGLEIQLQLETSLAESFRILSLNQTDIVARNIQVTTQNKENYLFTEPVVLNKQVLIQRKAESNNTKSPIRNQLDMGGITVFVPQDSPAILRLQNLAEEIGDSIYIVEDELYSSEQLLILVAKGDIDYAVCDLQTANQYLEKFPEIDTKTDISFTQLQSWAVRKDSPILLDSLNNWFNQLRDSGLYNSIYRKYYKY